MDIFAAKTGCFFKIRNILQFFKTLVFDLFTNKARNLKVAESNKAKASLTKPWLAINKANRSLVV